MAGPVPLQPGVQLGNTPAEIFAQTPTGVAVVRRAVFANITAGAIDITAWRLAAGGAVSNSNLILPTRSVAAMATDLAPELTNLVLNQGESIWAKASAAGSVNFFASGYTA